MPPNAARIVKRPQKGRLRGRAAGSLIGAPSGGGRLGSAGPGEWREMAVIAFARPVQIETEFRAHELPSTGPAPAGGSPDARYYRCNRDRRCGCARRRPRSRTTATPGMAARRSSPCIREFDRCEPDPAKIADQMVADHPRRCRLPRRRRSRRELGAEPSSAFSSTTPAKTQLPSAMTLPERITSANLSPSRPVSPELPWSIRNTIAAVQ